MTTLRTISDIYDDATFLPTMISAVNVATAARQEDTIAFIGARNRHSQITPEVVAKRFRCGLETAKQTLKTTTQRGI